MRRAAAAALAALAMAAQAQGLDDLDWSYATHTGRYRTVDYNRLICEYEPLTGGENFTIRVASVVCPVAIKYNWATNQWRPA